MYFMFSLNSLNKYVYLLETKEEARNIESQEHYNQNSHNLNILNVNLQFFNIFFMKPCKLENIYFLLKLSQSWNNFSIKPCNSLNVLQWNPATLELYCNETVQLFKHTAMKPYNPLKYLEMKPCKPWNIYWIETLQLLKYIVTKPCKLWNILW